MATEHFDVLIAGAGLSGIGVACHLTKKCPDKSFAILEARDAIGGTWDLFRYPGIRSDSDMFTLGYRFKPWTSDKGIADGGDIRQYIRDAAAENKVDEKIRFKHKVKNADWNSREKLWTVTSDVDGETRTYTAKYLVGCTGYYDYDEGFTPEFAGREDFKGQVIHPQFWPEDLDYTGKKVVVIGSGATAVTLIPSMSREVESITMLQRSPTYIVPVPSKDKLAIRLRKFLPESFVYSIIRSRNIMLTMAFYNYCKRFPQKARDFIFNFNKKILPKDFDMSHFTPKYNPWDERLCAVPGGDLYKAIHKGKADVVTDHIDKFVDNGILLKSGKTLEADIIITATGLKVVVLGKINVTMDGQPFDVTDKMSYRGVMFEGIPNAAMVFGYTNSSWTLKADLIADYFCRVVNYMDDKGYDEVIPVNHDPGMAKKSFIDLTSGYISRVKDQLPKQGTKGAWKLHQNYFRDWLSLRASRITAKELQYGKK
ncbi:MAG: NAD(P)/FAD-dependent oxidoreductase [Thalassolituus maritimus]|jgi:cation diffusion facilitator CzcD-associated flavoprotein CzcO|uniref:Predicted flavoprotein CzcO associated with the cation diffusion facilitator CzcD n=1 Tax=Thalassolituus maritimus TaxID=484498 RepID=A0A1N7LXA6_9GAMM|nr:NAD(P)/FAD-dependent oxidoreductase [Thalassolituus maritimus]TPD54794.1 MAG: NAD(P)/FAD-dependent oxidoreductase [Thalassolituus maritimus]SIS78475.1 Predicted flavoprotein CzcO associated with the cation diffusion facilitator CzcD [Thalassolituus maritimus]